MSQQEGDVPIQSQLPGEVKPDEDEKGGGEDKDSGEDSGDDSGEDSGEDE